MRIAISGAGVAGPALAHWLLRSGLEPVLIERAQAFRAGGYVIDFWGTGYEVARRMGIEQALLDAGYQVRELQSVGHDGEVLASLHTDAFRALAGGGYTSIPRGDLAATVHATLDGRVETRFGDSISALDPHDAGVRVAFERGDEREFDLVVGADGLHSNVRRLAFGDERRFTRYLGCHVAACVVEGYRPRDELVYVTHNVPGRQAGRFALRGDRTLFLFVFRAGEPEAGGDIDAQKRVLHREFADAGWECPRMLQAMDAVDELYFDEVSQIRMPHWSRGRVALAGDSAACVSLLAGEGTGLAMTEAYVLAGELLRAGGDHATAFAAYESRLRRFIEGKQAGAERLVGFFAARTRFGLWLRNLGLRAMDALPLAQRLGGRAVRDEFALPDYAFGPLPAR